MTMDQPGDQPPTDEDEQYQVIIARYGTRTTVKSDVYLHYSQYGEPDAVVDMDYFVWVVRNRRRTILIDTGFSRHGGEVRNRTLLTEVPRLYELLGVDPDDSPQIVITHAHFDHAGNIDHFPTSPILISRAEYEFWTGGHAHRPLFHHSVEDDDLDQLVRAEREGRVTFFTGRYEVAPGVEVIEVGGHTPGQCIVTVSTSEGLVLLTSDAVHYYDELELRRPFTTVADLVAMYNGFEAITSLIDSGEVSAVVTGHDPDTLNRFSPAVGQLAGIAVTIGAER